MATTASSAVPTSSTSISTWNLDPAHSIAEFKVKHMMISNVKGQFTGVQGSLILDDADLTRLTSKPRSTWRRFRRVNRSAMRTLRARTSSTSRSSRRCR